VENNADITKETPLKEALNLASPCRCGSCNNGCKYGSGIMVGKDAENIASFLKITKSELEKEYIEEVEQFGKKFQRPKLIRKGKPYGKCAFFDEEKGCKIHEAKPLQCRTSIACKDYGEKLSLWFMHNYLIDEKDEKSKKEYEIYKKSGGKIL